MPSPWGNPPSRWRSMAAATGALRGLQAHGVRAIGPWTSMAGKSPMEISGAGKWEDVWYGENQTSIGAFHGTIHRRFIVYSWDNHRTTFGWIFLQTALSEGTESMLTYELPYILSGFFPGCWWFWPIPMSKKIGSNFNYGFKDPWEGSRCTLVFKTILTFPV